MPDIDTIFIVHHTHTDIGFTHDQPIVWEMHRRFIDAAIDAAEAHLEHDGPHAFRWTIETTAPLLNWFRYASDRQIERFRRLERQGRLEVMACFVHFCPNIDLESTVLSLQAVDMLRRTYGLTVRHAMNCDVNGHNWPTADALLDAGIEAFQMAINVHAGGAPFRRPNLFHWIAPSGRRLLTLNGWHYHMGNWSGVGASIQELRERHLPTLLRLLDETQWKLPFFLLQYTHAFGDNATAEHHLPAFVKSWNETVGAPRMAIVTPRQFWAAVGPHAASLPAHGGDWTDYWNFGSISSAREVAISRRTRQRLLAADQLLAALAPLGVRPPGDAARNLPAADSPGRDPLILLSAAPQARREAWHNLILWEEHTWGADCHVSRPDSEDTAAQWHHKAHLAYAARSLSLMLGRDAVAELSLLVPRQPDDALLIYNPLPWPRVVCGPFPRNCIELRGTGDDPASSRHSQDRLHPSRYRLKPTELPPLGYRVVSAQQYELTDESPRYSESAVVEDAHRRMVFDRVRGGLVSWFDRRLNRELVDRTRPLRDAAPHETLPFGTLVYERLAEQPGGSNPRQRFYDVKWSPSEHVPDWHSGWRALRAVPRVLSHQVFHHADAIEVVQVLHLPDPAPLAAPNASPLASAITLRFTLFAHSPAMEVTAEYSMSLSTAPEATYLAFPFAVAGATTRIDVGHPIRPHTDQLPGTCRDYHTVQGYVDFSASDFGVTVAHPENPLVQIGDFHFGDFQKELTNPPAVLLGWITNNYWDTNFRAHQPGPVRARYRIAPHEGGFDEAEALRFAAEAAAPPLFQTAREPARAGAMLPREGSLLELPRPPVMLLHAWPAWSAGESEGQALYVRLYNASDVEHSARIGSGILEVVAVEECDVFGHALRACPVVDGAAQVRLGARRMATWRVGVKPPAAAAAVLTSAPGGAEAPRTIGREIEM